MISSIVRLWPSFVLPSVLPPPRTFHPLTRRGRPPKFQTRRASRAAKATAVSPVSHLDEPAAIYVHLPFCAQRCAYCAFTVLVSGRASLPRDEHVAEPQPAHESYVDVLCDEIDAFFTLYQHGRSQTPLIRSVYFGGGTPSLLHPRLFSRILKTIRTHVRLSDDVEITCEMDPATFTKDSARAFIEQGVNRVSIGVQSFDDTVLAECGRIHRRSDIDNAMEIMRQLNMNNISLDLICSLPFQSASSWESSLNSVLSYNCQHVSIYDLTLEPNTLFSSKYKTGQFPLPSDDDSSTMLAHAHSKLTDAGFEHYEISNFARDRSVFSRHNLVYWHNQPFFSFGIGATSLVNHFRYQRPTRLVLYTQYVCSLSLACANLASQISTQESVFPVLFPECKQLSRVEVFEDYVINSMRLLQHGVRLDEVRELFGRDIEDCLANAVQKCDGFERDGHLLVARTDEDEISGIRLSKTGAMIENSIVSQLLLEAVWRNSP